ncbi:nuclear transport factor 2 family protein [Lichenicola cladoniae]|uniref:Nuclear transport factor 2 family protein n=1 Tax=Lichenicola cladoniae TaxID=1484109 RepID=A0A6M8HT55_9PROT|nr:nuclear transport factor 2 family protein [Lichenicola cladoniae]NPD65550.1 nuclear transport factor 2 family protein [Acetobacteraceae bacterium]QKE91405.1 nuclear transport factor 2 family protein [Lichenicola cladoniae]
MDEDVAILVRIYDCFNARNIGGVLAVLTDDVTWANGMDGSHVHGHVALHDYWTRQWTTVSPHVEPLAFHRTADGAIVAEVRQSVRDLSGNPLQEQAHGLKDKTVQHSFRFRAGKVARFDIQDAA